MRKYTKLTFARLRGALRVMNIHAGAFLTLGTKKSEKDRKYESKSLCQRNNRVGLRREERLLEKHHLEQRETWPPDRTVSRTAIILFR